MKWQLFLLLFGTVIIVTAERKPPVVSPAVLDQKVFNDSIRIYKEKANMYGQMIDAELKRRSLDKRQ